MSTHYRIVFERIGSEEDKSEVTRTVVMTGEIEKPDSVFNLGFSHETQMELLHGCQDSMLKEQIGLLELAETCCPNCPDTPLVKYGKRHSDYHTVFTDHQLTVGRKRCLQCGYEPPSSIRTALGDSRSADLIRIQSELGANYTYRESEQLLGTFSRSERTINNHERIKRTTEQVGEQVRTLHGIESEIIAAEPADELVVNVDGGHINTTEEGKRSFEAMTAVIYRPQALASNAPGTRHTLTSKHCAASARNDGQREMINNTLVAALKQGLSPHTRLTVLCDGAENCWQIAEALRPLCASMTCILDWFHLSMKIQNIALLEPLKSKLIRVKWHLWRGKTENALIRLNSLISQSPAAHRLRLEKLKAYLENNRSRIINYRERQKNKLVFTSNLAESTVESLINRRCKGQQHMRWSREGLDPLLQLRAAIGSNDWDKVWRTAVRNAVCLH